MHFKAEHTRFVLHERTHLACPPRIARAYQDALRVVAIVVAVPTLLLLLTCIFHIPFLPVLLMIGLIAGLNRLVDPLARAAIRVLWPLHSRWLQRHRPDTLHHVKTRRVQVLRQPTFLKVDADSGELSLGGERRDLTRAWWLEVERAQDQGAQLRLRLRQHGERAWVLAAAPPNLAREALGAHFEALPRLEGEATVMAWADFVRLAALLEAMAPSNGAELPALLRQLARAPLPEAAPHEATVHTLR